MYMDTNFFQLIATRESCRSFDASRLPEKEKLLKCLEAARIAPSACNSQPWHITVITESSLLKQLSEAIGQKFTQNVPAFFVIKEMPAVLSERVSLTKEAQHYAGMDIGILAAHICLAATAQGLSTCMVGWFRNEESVCQLLGTEQKDQLRLLIAVGYANTDNLREKQRKTLEEISAFIE